MCIGDVWDLEKAHNELFIVIYAISEGVGMDLLQLVHNKRTQLKQTTCLETPIKILLRNTLKIHIQTPLRGLKAA